MACNCAIVLILSLTVLSTAAARFGETRNYLLGRYAQDPRGPVTSAPLYRVEWYQQRLDHFNAADQRTFQQRYLVNEDQWEGQGPILLYTGNEGDITWFCNNTVRRCDLQP